ncbi:ATP-dependent rRNA helicase SPB4 [Metschnikowia bicuspidata var. bicuspidata NRRL YB-4993]|uniref:ATP-dependent RNA helicase n=1 Tax=Metschnikowia bicuspidata var. bicuspidata NRRL YB-4993 TaxID=869754 RepID=A0A1A0HH10_9ASCO|nr:ATP-dependent rRNA helicase SPB4 [Metschnikowia bicuspidata var. bicuspidata NRRL YB-4993]OBA23464.1 ATP-dependent rRNA helicase SPB4 [Metschnikowia bicuspidata var. bicuspidata NRRL YB-4993]
MSSLLWETLESQLHPWLYEAVVSLEYPTMTPVQASTIPLFSKNKDVIVESVTGSGKTLSFVVPVLQHISNRLYGHAEDTESPDPVKKGHMLAIVISPTRELASQTQAVFDRVLQFLPELKTKINTQLVVGSLSSVRQDLDTLLTTRSHILVATPGRLLDLLKSLKVHTSSVEVAVLDEADKLLDLSFENDVLSILRTLPNQRRTGLYSATLSSAGSRVFNTGLNNPVRIAVKSKLSSKAAPSSLTIQYAFVEPEKKLTSFLNLLHKYRFKKCIVYLPTCTGVKHFYNLLKELTPKKTLIFHSLHGQLTTNARLKTLQSFTEGDALEAKHVLMTTDVAARGIDIPDVDLVVQLDPPTDPDVFVHRCGRTGRANKAGRAIVMLNKDSNEEDFVGLMEVKKVDMTELELPCDEDFHTDFQEKSKIFMLEDRARHELAVKSYVGFVRYYHKHIASSIFRMLSLDYLGIAKMYGLLRLPKMPETRYIEKDKMPENGWLIKEDFDMDKYAYADEAKEKARLENMEAEKMQKINDAKARKLLKKKNEAWSVKMDTKETKTVRREKNKKKRDAIEKQIMEEPSEDEEAQVDWKDLVRQSKKPRNDTGMQGSFDDL